MGRRRAERNILGLLARMDVAAGGAKEGPMRDEITSASYLVDLESFV